MAEPNSDHVNAVAHQPGNNYDAAEPGAMGPFKKMLQAAPQQGHGWTYADDISDAQGNAADGAGGWRQV